MAAAVAGALAVSGLDAGQLELELTERTVMHDAEINLGTLSALHRLGVALSIDDFVISFFVAGPGSTTLPIKIYSMIKYGAPPLINALSTLLLAITFLCVAASQYLSNRGRQAA